MTLSEWLYRGGRPNWLASALNAFWAEIHALGLAPNYLVTLEVRGRRTGKRLRLPLVMARVNRERYLVSMLGDQVEWVRNAKAADWRVALDHGRREDVVLEPVPVKRRAPILKVYLQCAPGARGHVPVDKDAPLSEFEAIAATLPVFRVNPAPSE